jgi:hypothetical protein
MKFVRQMCGLVFALFMTSFSLQAADRTKAIAFMEVTGFDVSLRSMRVSAADAPAMLGLDAEDFGLSWSRLADEIFEPTQIEQDALAILERALRDDVLMHVSAFYASNLGQRLVDAENESHFTGDLKKRELGHELAVSLENRGSPQPQYFRDMANDIGSIESSIRSYREVQVRFLMAAMSAGLMQRQLDEADLREILSLQDTEIKSAMMENIIVSNAYTYRKFSDLEVEQYRDALGTKEMREVYALMNAIHFTLMAERYEQMALKMADLHPSQSL